MKRELIAHVEEETKQLGDLFGLFFEDINHAADGGLYAEMVQNRSFEYCSIDNKDYYALTAWEKSNDLSWEIFKGNAVSQNNPHHLLVTGNKGEYFYNLGYGKGMHFVCGDCYEATLRLRVNQSICTMNVALGELVDGKIQCISKLVPIEIGSTEWSAIEITLQAATNTEHGVFLLTFASDGVVDFDTISLFPAKTYKNRRHGLRRDLAECLEQMHPKFLRFPGGCLTHDGSLDANARNSMYRWKNTIGPEYDRPAKRNNWGYNQTLGLGYYEYFLFCEDIGAEPLPVVPAGFNPHKGEGCPFEEIDEWVKETLDLIDFANGDISTEWGRKRIELGHEEPFHLKYLAVGNEEIGEGFFERYPYFHEAIRKAAPEIQIINSAGPFAEGEGYETGWSSAKKHGSDLVDEHYYSNTEWYLANMHHYDNYDVKGPGVFLGEYASWGNTLYNALVEAAYMTHLEKACAVKLACYAPLFCNVSYKNWTPDMIFFDEGKLVCTPNYYVQRLFMEHQGTAELSIKEKGFESTIDLYENDGIYGNLCIRGNDIEGCIRNLVVKNLENEESLLSVEKLDIIDNETYDFGEIHQKKYSVEFEFERTKGRKGLYIELGKKEEDSLLWEFGGWDNWDCNIQYVRAKKGSTISQKLFHVEDIHYKLRIEVDGKNMKTYINGVMWNNVMLPQPKIEDLYVCASKDDCGNLFVKIVNLTEEEKEVSINFEAEEKCIHAVKITELHGNPTEENTFEHPDMIKPDCHMLEDNGKLFWKIKGYSLTVVEAKIM